jgi:hypothetical protein
MNQYAHSSSAGSFVNQYWQLINVMLFSLKVVGYIVVFFLGVAIVSAALSLVFPDFAILASISFSIFSFVGFMGLPVGVFVLAGNRSINLAANIKKKLFLIMFTTTLLTVLINIVFIVNPVHAIPKMNLMVMCLLFCPLYFMLTIFIADRDISLSMFSPVLMIVIAKTAFAYLSDVPVAWLSVGAVASWVLFHYWWMSFTLKGGAIKSALLQVDSSGVQEPLWEKLVWFKVGNISTAMGTFLLGRSDHVFSFLKRILFIFFISFLWMFYASNGFKLTEFYGDKIRIAIFAASAYSFILISMDFYSRKMMLNMKRAWLVFAGNREGLFLYMESFFWRGLAWLVSFNFVLLALFLLFTHQLQYLMYVAVGVLIMSLIITLDFYWDIYCYRKGQQAGHINVRKAIVSACLVIMSCYYLVEKYSAFNKPEMKDGVALLVVLLVIVLLKPARKVCMKRFKWVDI